MYMFTSRLFRSLSHEWPMNYGCGNIIRSIIKTRFSGTFYTEVFRVSVRTGQDLRAYSSHYTTLSSSIFLSAFHSILANRSLQNRFIFFTIHVRYWWNLLATIRESPLPFCMLECFSLPRIKSHAIPIHPTLRRPCAQMTRKYYSRNRSREGNTTKKMSFQS